MRDGRKQIISKCAFFHSTGKDCWLIFVESAGGGGFPRQSWCAKRIVSPKREREREKKEERKEMIERGKKGKIGER